MLSTIIPVPLMYIPWVPPLLTKLSVTLALLLLIIILESPPEPATELPMYVELSLSPFSIMAPLSIVFNSICELVEFERFIDDPMKVLLVIFVLFVKKISTSPELIEKLLLAIILSVVKLYNLILC